MSDRARDLGSIISRHRASGLIIDTNILLLWMLGSVDRELVPRFKRTQQFDPSDFDLLCRLLSFLSSKVVASPNVLPEVTNLANSLSGQARLRFWAEFRSRVRTVSEIYVPSADAVENPRFGRLGLTDCSILSIATSAKVLVLTDDLALAGALESHSTDVINFNHLRFGGPF
jgi:rRNA-processing protein FCF1